MYVYNMYGLADLITISLVTFAEIIMTIATYVNLSKVT